MIIFLHVDDDWSTSRLSQPNIQISHDSSWIDPSVENRPPSQGAMKIVDVRRKSLRKASATEETKQSRNQERVNTTLAVMTTFDKTTPVDSDAFSLGSVDSLSSSGDPLRFSVKEAKVLQKEKYYSKRKGKTEMAKFLDAREMTATQERWNAITILPNPIFCLYYIFASHWASGKYASIASMDQDFDQVQCLKITWLPYALPPWPVACITAAICLHAPASFLYHWVYSHSLTPIARISHWSRRLDQVFIHIASALLAYGTSGSWDYFLVNLMYNGDCIYRQLLKKVRLNVIHRYCYS